MDTNCPNCKVPLDNNGLCPTCKETWLLKKATPPENVEVTDMGQIIGYANDICHGSVKRLSMKGSEFSVTCQDKKMTFVAPGGASMELGGPLATDHWLISIFTMIFIVLIIVFYYLASKPVVGKLLKSL